MKLSLDKRKPHYLYGHRGFPWISCPPFVENSRGVLIHRPRTGITYNLHKNPHLAISFLCGMSVTSSGKNLTLLSEPPEGKILCARCEDAAIAKGLPRADELAGRHVHIGRTVAVVTCCPEGKCETDTGYSDGDRIRSVLHRS